MFTCLDIAGRCSHVLRCLLSSREELQQSLSFFFSGPHSPLFPAFYRSPHSRLHSLPEAVPARDSSAAVGRWGKEKGVREEMDALSSALTRWVEDALFPTRALCVRTRPTTPRDGWGFFGWAGGVSSGTPNSLLGRVGGQWRRRNGEHKAKGREWGEPSLAPFCHSALPPPASTILHLPDAVDVVVGCACPGRVWLPSTVAPHARVAFSSYSSRFNRTQHSVLFPNGLVVFRASFPSRFEHTQTHAEMSETKAEKRAHTEENGEESEVTAKQSKVEQIKEANANEKKAKDVEEVENENEVEEEGDDGEESSNAESGAEDEENDVDDEEEDDVAGDDDGDAEDAGEDDDAEEEEEEEEE
uniref:Prothymosin alpha-like n=1 Tax=Bursaphelenchus xylophilus TaxID=6326 RepID=A0A1I7SX68_BURXY